MDVLLLVWSIMSILICLKRFRELREEVVTEKKKTDITFESMLFFMASFELIRLFIKYIIN
jgi:hypothetical protein